MRVIPKRSNSPKPQGSKVDVVQFNFSNRSVWQSIWTMYQQQKGSFIIKIYPFFLATQHLNGVKSPRATGCPLKQYDVKLYFDILAVCQRYSEAPPLVLSLLDGLIPTRDYSYISTYYENRIRNKAQNPANTSITLVGVCMLVGRHKAPAEILYLDSSLFSEIYTWRRARHFEK